jgi:hypothetical protein
MVIELLNTDAYEGQYVALRSFEDRVVVGAGHDPATALGEAKKNGVDEPVLLYVEEKDRVQIY